MNRPKHVIAIDFETYYDKEYSLRNMPMQAYVTDPLFEIIGAAVRLDNQPIEWRVDRPGEHFSAWLQSFPWGDAVCVAHNAMFDGLILEGFLNIRPKQYFCTAMAAKPIMGHLGGVSLKAVAERLGIGQKGEEVHDAIGKHLKDFAPEELAAYGNYCKNDVSLTWMMYQIFKAWFEKHDTSGDEIGIIDSTVKQFTRPLLRINNAIISDRLEAIEKEKEEVLDRLGVTPEQLRSDAQFAALLSAHGVEAPEKISARTGKSAHAFAKNDAAMKELAKHPDTRVRDLVQGRLLFKSTIEASRLERLLSLNGGFGGGTGPLCVPLQYYGAHTGRFSGRDFINLQNLGRGGILRQSIEAPPGYKIIAADLAQIEARLTAAFCGQTDLLEQFRKGEDVYAAFASKHYGYAVNAADHPKERFVGKTGILSLGYQAGHIKFHDTMNNVFDTPISHGEAEDVVYTYRRQYRKIVGMWYDLNDMIPMMARGKLKRKVGPIMLTSSGVILPNGMPLRYHDLNKHEGEWTYSDGFSRKKLYGGKMLENIIQALARIVMTTAMMRMVRHGLQPAMSVHDELVFCVKEDDAQLVAMAVQKTMEDVVQWMPELPVKCEVAVGDNYAQCK